MNKQPDPEWFELMETLCNGDISVEAHAQLEMLLKTNPDARKFYYEYLEIHMGLEQPVAADLLREQSPIARSGESLSLHTITLSRSTFFACVSAVAALFLIAIFGWWMVGQENNSTTDSNGMLASTDASVGRLVWEDDAVWEQGVYQISDLLNTGWIRLQSGAAEIAFHSGATVVLEGPAAMRLDTAMLCYVEMGTLAAAVPPEATGFTILSKGGRVVDLGTSFGMKVSADGQANVHVLEGEVELYAAGADESNLTGSSGHLLTEKHAATLSAEDGRIEDFDFDAERFSGLVSATIHRQEMLKLQFDCGSIGGLYQGSGSPAHAVGDVHPHEEYWNQIVGDQAGRFLKADGNPCPDRLVVDFGWGQKQLNWEGEPTKVRGGQGLTYGVFDNALGKDSFHGGGVLGIRIGGLPVGRYRVYLMGRGVIDTKWGLYLVNKTHIASIGRNLDTLDEAPMDMLPLADPDARAWVVGQTHVTAEVEITGPNDYLSMVTRKDPKRSTPGGQAVIQGFQIIQLQ